MVLQDFNHVEVNDMFAINKINSMKEIVNELKLNGMKAELTKTKAQILNIERSFAKEC